LRRRFCAVEHGDLVAGAKASRTSGNNDVNLVNVIRKLVVETHGEEWGK
jgi:hypothetical protein